MDREEIISLLTNADCFKLIEESVDPVLKKRGLDFGYELLCDIGDKEVHLLIGFDKHFPIHKPDYFLKPKIALGHIPHVEKDGKICYTHDDYLSIDYNNPLGIITESFSAVNQTLLKGYSGENKDDFLNEFEAYWRDVNGCKSIFSNIAISNQPKKIKIGEKDRVVFAMDDTPSGADIMRRILENPKVPLSNAIYIPFELGSKVFPPPSNHEYTLLEVKEMVEGNISRENKKILTDLSNGRAKNVEYLIITQPQPNGNHAFFGFKLSKIKSGIHPLSNSPSVCKVEPIEITRLDKDYLSRRGGNGHTFDNKKGMVIGCGSIGGYIIQELVKSSFLDLTIVDKETLSPENSYRHLCGIANLNQKKVEAIKEEIERYNPHASIKAIADSIENVLLNAKQVDLSRFQFIVVATGNVTINMYLNEYLFRNHPGIPIFFVWLDPYGIGAHCLVTNLKAKGCYQCLYNNDEVYNSASFANKVQSKLFLKAISGCGSVYTPFASIDAYQAAILTVRIISKFFQDNELRSAVNSIKGDPGMFVSEGYQVSDRFNQSTEELERFKYDFISPTCKVCKA